MELGTSALQEKIQRSVGALPSNITGLLGGKACVHITQTHQQMYTTNTGTLPRYINCTKLNKCAY